MSDQWNIGPIGQLNPYQELRSPAKARPRGMQSESATGNAVSVGTQDNTNVGYSAKSCSMSKHDTTIGIGLNDAVYFNVDSAQYEDIDDFLTQELKDLDIPLAPRLDAMGVPDYNYPRAEQEGNSMLLFPNALDWAAIEQTVLESPPTVVQTTPKKSQKREPSGTAIFGFSNHNKTLSIGRTVSGDNTGLLSAGVDVVDSNKNPEGGEPRMRDLILKQQEELGLALEKQKEMNRQLEEQLKINKMQQLQLQRALSQQRTAVEQSLRQVNETSIATPIRHNHHDDSIRTNSQSRSSIYELHSANCAQNPDFTSASGKPTNGSPVKRSLPRQDTDLLTLMTSEPSDKPFVDRPPQKVIPPVAMERPLMKFDNNTLNRSPQSSEYTKESLTRSLCDIENVDEGPSGAQNQSISKSPGKLVYSPNLSSTLHQNKQSITSTTSISASVVDENDTESVTGKLQKPTTIGLGVDRYYQSKPKFVLSRPPSLGGLSKIPGSVAHNPLKNKEPISPQGYPPKCCFQNTPIKDSPNRSTPMASAEQTVKDYQENPKFFEITKRTELQPPSISYHGHRQSFSDSGDEHEGLTSEFVQAQSPSPILRSQSRFENQSQTNSCSNKLGSGHLPGSGIGMFGSYKYDYYSQANQDNSERLSPMKKASNLPQGEIDQYIKKFEDKTFQCLYPDCSKIFNRRYNIRSHIQTHLEDRPFKCDHQGCTKAFVRNHDLIRHKKTHAEKTFVCPCGKRFSREDALLTHRTRLICVGGKKFDNIVIKKSPRKRGRPKKDGSSSVNSSPVKEVIARDYSGSVTLMMEEQLQRHLDYHHSLEVPEPNRSMDMRTPIPLALSSNTSPMKRTSPSPLLR